jgi:hypothetical protein
MVADKDVESACKQYALDNEDAGGYVAKLTFEEDHRDFVKYTSDTWKDGVPVTKMFERNSEISLFIPAGTTVMGVVYTGRATGQELFEFVYGGVWYRTYAYIDDLEAI